MVQARVRRALTNLQKGEAGVQWFGTRFGKIAAESMSVGVVYTTKELLQIYLGKMKKGERMVARRDKKVYGEETRGIESWEEAHQVLVEAEEKKDVNLEARVHGTRSSSSTCQQGRCRKDWSRNNGRSTSGMYARKGAGHGPMQGGGAGKGKGSRTPSPVRIKREMYVT